MMILFYLLLMLVVYLLSEIIDLWNTVVGSAFFYMMFFILWFDYVFLESVYKLILVPLKQIVEAI